MTKALALAAATVAMAASRAAAGDGFDVERLVRQDCGACHGMTLKGGLGPAITPEAVARYDDETLATIILDGVPGTPMPPWRPLLAPGQVEPIVRFLRTGDAE
ncbi:MAG: cytochrome c [Alphaproteobacteria bacterium]|nr:MAG: cytochrome c [Alphaproteobacteria bacterium]